MRAFRVVAGSCGGAAALAACHGVSRPLHIVWDLDETLVSSRQIERVSGEPPLTPNQILHIKRSEAVPSIEHIDDDAMHFVTHARPHAIALLHALRWLPGVQQHVSTSASPGYMKNILALLDPDREVRPMGRSSVVVAAAGRRVVPQARTRARLSDHTPPPL